MCGTRNINNTAAFQSRFGFPPRRDMRRNWSRPSRWSCFNPALGFYRVATFELNGEHRHLLIRFNPALGFYRVATGPVRASSVSAPSFNPALGFYRVATRGSRDRPAPGQCFNPALGFYRVATVSSKYLIRSRCFNPALGFYRVATGGPD